MVFYKKFAGLEPPVFDTHTNAFVSPNVFVPLKQDTVSNVKPIVAVGDSVKEGQILARDVNGMCNIHSPISGIIDKCVLIPLCNGKKDTAFSIKLGGSFEYLGKNLKKQTWDFLSPDQLIRLIAEKGVVNTFRKAIPLSAQLLEMKNSGENRNIILRLYDFDPTSYTDSYVVKKFLPEIVEGIATVAKVLEPAAIYCLYDKNSSLSELAMAMQGMYSTIPFRFIPVDITKYPCGEERNIIRIIKAFTKDKLPCDVTRKDLFLDSVTSYAVYNAIILDVPLMTRFVSVTGDALKEQKIFNVRIGTPIYKLVEECGGFIEKPKHIVANGLIAGTMINSLSVPVTKDLKSITILSSRASQKHSTAPCVRCGKCRSVCPEKLQPDVLYNRFINHMLIPNGELLSTLLCSECRLCNVVCPAQLPLFQSIEEIKKTAEKQYE